MEKRILLSLAQWLMLEKCKEVNIDPSGTHIENPRTNIGTRTFNLRKDDSSTPIMQVTFRPQHAPVFIY